MIKFRKKRGVALFLSAVFAISMIGSTGIQANADSITEVKQEQQETRKKKQEAEKKLKELNSLKSDIISVIQELDNQISAYETKIANLTLQLNAVQAQISVNEINLQNANALEAQQYDAMKERIQYAYENGDVAYIDALMSVTNFTDVINQSEHIEQVSDYDKQQLESLVEIKAAIAEYEAELQEDRAAVEEIKAEAEDEKEALQVMVKGKQEKLSQYNVAIADTEDNITKLQRDEQEQEAKIKKLEEEAERRRRELEKQKQQQPTTPKLPKPSDTPSETPKGNGSLVWPMPASRNITSRFGPRKSPTAGASSYHQGIDIACPSGSAVVAAASGTVISTGYSSAGGNTVIISHGSMTTCYFHLSGFAVSAGTSVSAGQVVAYSGNTGVSTGPHLHFAVRINGSYVNPMNYF